MNDIIEKLATVALILICVLWAIAIGLLPLAIIKWSWLMLAGG